MLSLETRKDSDQAFDRLRQSLGCPKLSDDKFLDAVGWLVRGKMLYYFEFLINETPCDWHKIFIGDYYYELGARASFDFDSDSIAKSPAIALSAVLVAIDECRLYPTRVSVIRGCISLFVGDQLIFEISKIRFHTAPNERTKRVRSALKGVGLWTAPIAAKLLSKIPGFELFRYPASPGDNTPLSTTLSTIVTLMIVSLSESGVFIQRGQAQECLARFLNLKSWNHLVAKARVMGIFHPSPIAYRSLPETKGSEPPRDTYTFYRTTTEALAALSLLVDQSPQAMKVSGNVSLFGHITATAYTPNTTSPPDEFDFQTEMMKITPDQNSAPGWDLACLTEVEMVSSSYNQIAKDLTYLDEKELEEALIDLFGRTKLERLAGTRKREETTTLALGPWLFSHEADAWTPPTLVYPIKWVEILDADGHSISFVPKGYNSNRLYANKTQIMVDAKGNCILVQEDNKSDCVLTGLDHEDAVQLAAFFRIQYHTTPGLYSEGRYNSSYRRPPLIWPNMPK